MLTNLKVFVVIFRKMRLASVTARVCVWDGLSSPWTNKEYLHHSPSHRQYQDASNLRFQQIPGTKYKLRLQEEILTVV